MFKGLPQRLIKEIKALSPELMQAKEVKLLLIQKGNSPLWMGGFILLSNSQFKSIFITIYQFEENGPIIIQRKMLLNFEQLFY